MSEALKPHRSEDLRLLDILRAVSFSLADTPFKGDERDIFVREYKAILDEWTRLKDDMG